MVCENSARWERKPTIFGAATIIPTAIGIPKKSKKFIVFSIATFSLSSSVLVESFEKTGYIMGVMRIVGKKFSVSNRRYAAPYQPTTAEFVITERRTVSIR